MSDGCKTPFGAAFCLNGANTIRRLRPLTSDAMRAIAKAIALSAAFGCLGGLFGGRLWLIVGFALGAIWCVAH